MGGNDSPIHKVKGGVVEVGPGTEAGVGADVGGRSAVAAGLLVGAGGGAPNRFGVGRQAEKTST
jgi:hypothetical protein